MFGCGSNNQDSIPYVPVNIQINLLNPDFQPLSIDGGYVYITGGARGILVYRESSTNYLAFERNCTFEPSADCARIIMDSSNLFMADTCCGSQFDFNGNITGGPAPFNLLQYSTLLNSNYLTITN